MADLGRALSDAVLDVVRARMAEQGLSGRALAERVGIHFTTLAAHLRGRGDMSLDELDAVALALGVNRAEELIEEARRRM